MKRREFELEILLSGDELWKIKRTATNDQSVIPGEKIHLREVNPAEDKAIALMVEALSPFVSYLSFTNDKDHFGISHGVARVCNIALELYRRETGRKHET